jgi:Flp pilus assembly pilin Flp
MMSKLRHVARDTRGATLVEYVILVGVVAIIAFVGFQTFGTKVRTKINNQAAFVDGVPDKSGAAGGTPAGP